MPIKHVPTLYYFSFGYQLQGLFKATKNTAKLFVVQHHPVGFNFAICEIRARGPDDLSPITLFISTAQLPIWFCLTFSMILTSLLIKARLRKSDQPVFIATLSVSISPGPSAASRDILRFWLFTLWTVFSLLWWACYSEAVTSTVISPGPWIWLTKIQQLVEKKFSFVFSSRFTLSQTENVIKFRGGKSESEDVAAMRVLNGIGKAGFNSTRASWNPGYE